jgi:hypothetical protein
VFCVNVASKGLRFNVSLLFTTLAGEFISVAFKGVTRAKCWREGNWVVWEDSAGIKGATWRTSMVRTAHSLPGLSGRAKGCTDYV